MSDPVTDALSKVKPLETLKGPEVEAPKTDIPTPVETRKYVRIKGKDVTQAGSEQADLLMQHGGKVRMAVIKYAQYIAPPIIESQATVATGPDFPYVVAWVSRDEDAMAQAAAKGYRPVNPDSREFASRLVIGEQALSLLIDRSPRMMRHYASVKIPTPSKLPEELRDAWGFFLPPFVNERNRVIYKRRELWYIEKEVVEDRRKAISRATNGRNPNQTDANFLAGDVGGEVVDRIRIDLD